MKTAFVLPTLVAFAGISVGTFESEASQACKRQDLIGAWKLASAEDVVNGEWVATFGENPRGYFSFGSDGTASVQFMRYPIDGTP